MGLSCWLRSNALLLAPFLAVVLLLIIGFPVALVLAWAFEITPEGIKLAQRAWLSYRLLNAAEVDDFAR